LILARIVEPEGSSLSAGNNEHGHAANSWKSRPRLTFDHQDRINHALTSLATEFDA
jgi:hypothetical protein